jgi:hypothetical protein
MKLDELSTSKYLPFPKELCELTMTLSRYISKIHLRVREVQTNILTATRQFDGCELLFVVFLERRAKLGYEVGAFDSESFDIYCNIFRIKGPALGVVFVPAMTPASLRFVSSCLEHVKDWTYFSWGRSFHECRHCGELGSHLRSSLGV